MSELRNKTVLILGAGFSGKAIGERCARAGATVLGTTRSTDKFAPLLEADIQPLLFDGQTFSAELLSAFAGVTHLVVSVAPPRSHDQTASGAIVDPSLRALGERSLSAVAPSLNWIGYLSTVGVYGNHDGAWVDEETEICPISERSKQRVRAETEWQDAGKQIGLPTAIFRLSGIYGPGRNALKNAKEGKARRLNKPGQVFNRIHVADIAAAVHQAMAIAASGLFNITDDEPSPPQEVVAFAHQLLGLEPPPEQDFATADLTPMARSFYGENKRVSNAKSKRVLGLEYAYPNYRTALQTMLDDGSWV